MTVPLLLVLAQVASPPAEDARWGLRWQAPAECVRPADLARAVEEKLGRAVFGPAAELTIDGVLKAGAAPRWKAQLVLVDARGTVLGQRDVASDEASCAGMTAQVALVVAVMIDPRAAFGAPPPTSAPPPPPTEPPPPAEPAPKLPEQKPLPRAEPAALAAGPAWTRGEVTLGASGTYGLGLSASLGAQLLVNLKWQALQGFEWWFSLYPRNDVWRDGGLAAVHALQTAFTVCPLRAEAGLALFSLCAGVAGTIALTHTEGYLQGAQGFIGRPDAVARARLRLGFGAFALGFGVMGAVGPVRPTMVVLKPNGSSEVVPVGSWAWGAAELSLGARWR